MNVRELERRGARQPGKFHLKPGLLPHFANHGGVERLARIDLAPGPFPVADEGPVGARPAQEQCASGVVQDHGFDGQAKGF